MKSFLKTLFFGICAVSMISVVPSCKKGSLTDINKNPDAISYIVPDYSFTAAVLNSIPDQNYRALGQDRKSTRLNSSHT